MPSKKKTEPAAPRYEVRSALTGAIVCGPYDSKSDADREVQRLNKECAIGRTENGVELTRDGRPLRHGGLPMRYETVTLEGVVIAGG